MKSLRNVMRMTSCGLIACAILCAPASAFGWDEQGLPIVGQKYGFGDLSVKSESCIPVKENGLWGFINEKGKVTIKPVYEEIGEPQSYKSMYKLEHVELSKVAIPVKKNGKWGFVGQNGKEMVKPEFDKVGTFTSTLVTDKYGDKSFETTCLAFQGNNAMVIDTKGKIVKALGGGFTSFVNTDCGLIGIGNGKAQLINGDPNTQIKVYDNYILVYDGRSGALYSLNGDKLQRVAMTDPNSDHAIWKVSDGYMVLDRNYAPWNGKVYKSYNNNNDNYLRLTTPEGITEIYTTFYPYLNHVASTDKYVTNITEDYIFFAPDSTTQSYGMMKHDGTQILPAEYSTISLSDDYLIVSKDGKKSLLSATGETLLPFDYESISASGNGNYLVTNDKGVAVFSAPQKKMIMPFGKYTSIGKQIFSGNAVWVSKGNKWGVATADLSREIVPPIYDDKEIAVGHSTTLDNKYRTIHIKKNGTVGVINFDGKTIIPVGRYTGIKGYDLKSICVQKGKKVGLVDQMTGRQIVPPIHDKIDCSGKNHVLALDNTANGQIFYIYDLNTGALLKKQAFTNSQAFAAARFLQDWVGAYNRNYDFTY